jgi:hypothetical protein
MNARGRERNVLEERRAPRDRSRMGTSVNVDGDRRARRARTRVRLRDVERRQLKLKGVEDGD